MGKSLSKESEQRLLTALERVTDLTNSGMHPNAAITKVAEAQQIPAGHVRLMVNAVNTGRTNAQRMSSTDPLEKASEFPVADATTILSALYPDEVKTKAAEYLSSFVSNEYERSPAWLKEKAARVKAARAVDWKMTSEKPIVERDPLLPMKKAHAATTKLRHSLDAQRLEVAQHREAAIKLASELRTYFAKPGHIPYKEVAENCEILMGKAASVVLNYVAPKKEASVKCDATPVNIHAAPYSLIKRAIEVAKLFNESQEAYKAAVKTAHVEAEKLLLPFVVSPAQGRSVLADLCSQQSLTKEGFLGTFVGRGLGMMAAGDIAREVGKRMRPATGPEMERKDLESLLDPGHEAEIRNMQSEALLNDLLANDEVIKGYDPEESIDAFNEISQLAPYATSTKAVMRDLMRKRLAGGAAALDQFTVGDTIGQQEKLRNIQSPNDSRLYALQTLGVLNGPAQRGGSVLGGH